MIVAKFLPGYFEIFTETAFLTVDKWFILKNYFTLSYHKQQHLTLTINKI